MDRPEKREELSTEQTKKDLKRIAVLGGTLGRENRYYVRGQVVDVGIDDVMKAEGIWDFVTGILKGKELEITPFLDFSLAPVRKPILKAEIYDESSKLVYTSDAIYADEDGFFSLEMSHPLPKGEYVLQLIITGLNSYRQYSRDIARINRNENSEIARAYILGKSKLRILDENYTSYITTSDIDQTYLSTDIHSNKGKFATLFETPTQKLPLPGMPTLYQRLRRDTENTPLTFISASPHFFRRTLLATINYHEINSESLHLKYLDGTVKGVLDKIIGTVSNPKDFFSSGMRQAMERTRKFFSSSYQSLFDQMAYKLTILLRSRLYFPKNAKEILMGDNTESDYMIFTLYQLILEGKISTAVLEQYLYELNFLGRDAITRDNAKTICQLAEENIKLHGKINPVALVLINQTEHGPTEKEMRFKVESAISPILRLDETANPHFYGTQGSIGFSVILACKGIINQASILDVVSSTVGEWIEGKVVNDVYLLNWVKNLHLPDFAQETREWLVDVVERTIQ